MTHVVGILPKVCYSFNCYLITSHSFRRHTITTYLQVITDGCIKSTECINCYSAGAWPEYLFLYIYLMSVLFHVQIGILKYIKKSFPMINIHNVNINFSSFPPKTKQSSLHLCPCINKELSLRRTPAAVSNHYQPHIRPHAMKLSSKSHQYPAVIQGQNKAR